MASCACGADIRWGVIETTRERIPLEYHAELGPGENRYLVTGVTTDNLQHLLTPVAPNSTVEAYVDHRLDCPDYGNGLR